MSNNFIDIFLARHGMVDIYKDMYGRKMLHQVDIALNADGQVETYELANMIKSKMSYKQGKPTFDFIISGPKVRAVQSAWILSHFIPSTYISENDTLENDKSSRFFIKNYQMNLDPLYDNSQDDYITVRKREIIKRELKMELAVKQSGILIDDRLDDILPPPIDWEKLPKEKYQQINKNATIPEENVKKAVAVINDILNKLYPSKSNNFSGMTSSHPTVLIETHENTGIAILSHFERPDLLISSQTIKALNSAYPFERGNCYRIRLSLSGDFIEKEKIEV